jgi:poly(3-hydroxybutyrate) depolymerase
VQLYQVVDGGHTWPGGFPYSAAVGPMSMDFSANAAIVDFFAAHR